MNTKSPKKPILEDWHPADVKAALHKKGITLAGLAKSYGLEGSSSLSATFTRSLPTNEQRIADAIGVHPKVIWPSRYNEDGSRKPQGFRAIQDCTPLKNSGNSKRIATDGNLAKVV